MIAARPFILAALLPLAPTAPFAFAAESPVPPRLTVEELFAEGAAGRQAENLTWSPDGTRLAYTWDDGQGEALWVMAAASGAAERVLRLKGEEPAPAGAQVDEKQGEELDDLGEVQWSPRGDALLLLADDDLFLLPLAGRRLERLTETAAEEEDPKLSPDGSRVAFVRDADLWLLDLGSRRETRLTSDGKEGEILNGKTDWLYWEEIWGRDSTGHWWSPDGGRIAYYRFDESAVGRYPLVNELPRGSDRYPEVTWQRYPKAGEPNAEVKVGVLDLASGRTTWMATGEEDAYLARVDWTPAGDALAVQRLSRDQTRLDLLRCAAGPEDGGRCAPLATQEWPTWVNLGDDLRFLPDGRFLWGAEDEGYRRLYLHAADGRRGAAVTPAGWTIASLDGLLESAVVVTGFANEGLGATRRQVLRCALGGSCAPLTSEPGWSAALVAPKTGWLVHTWSDASTPGWKRLLKPDGSAGATLPSAPPRFDPATLPQWEMTTIDGPGGAKLPARLLKPAGFDLSRPSRPSRPYPAIVYHYGGPGSQVVVDRWDGRGRDLWHQMMATRGFAVAMVDNRASLFFGKRGEDLIHRDFGTVNLEAQLALVEHLKGLGWVDPARIGLWGWSGGGTNTLECVLRRPGVWRAAVAGAPVTDWQLYDTAWTERYLGRPQENPQGYEASSPVSRAAALADRLLLVHGTGDDNVHPQNTTVIAQQLIEAGKVFEEAFYPNQKHGMRGAANRHFFARMTDFFERNLAPAPGTGVASR